MPNNEQHYLSKIPAADAIGLPKVYKIACFLIVFIIVASGLLLWFTPWVQTAMGQGAVDSLNPSDRTPGYFGAGSRSDKTVACSGRH